MIKNYLLSAFRNTIRYKSFSLLNIAGLALSMSVCLLIIMIILDQTRYDDFHEKGDRIYRILTNDELSEGNENRYATTAFPLGEYMKDRYPGVEDVAIIRRNFGGEGRYEDQLIAVEGLYVNQGFFRIFDFPVSGADPEMALEDLQSVFLREEIAAKFYGEEDPIGKHFSIDSVGEFIVAGIIPETEGKSHIQFDILASVESVTADYNEDWGNVYGTYAYLLLEEGIHASDINAVFEEIRNERYGGDPEYDFTFSLQSLNKISPGPMLGNELGFFLPRSVIYFMVVLALVVMLTSAFNYTNMSLAKAFTRTREIGIRKVHGASRGQIFVQFLVESVLVALLALFVAYIVLQFLAPAFEGMKVMSFLQITVQENISVYAWFLLFAIATGIVAGLLPAGYLSSFNPIVVFKDTFSIRIFSRMFLRKFLIVAQFCVSIILVITIILLYRQLRFFINTDYGFQMENVLNVEMQGNKQDRLAAEIAYIPEVKKIAWSSIIPGTGSRRSDKAWHDSKEEAVDLAYFAVDQNYIDVLELNLLAGSNFPETAGNGLEKYIILNETAVEIFKFPRIEEALGNVITIQDTILVEIIGVVEDYHFFNMFSKIGPMGLRLIPPDYKYAHLQVSSPDIIKTMEKIEMAWKEVDPEHDLQANFTDDLIRDYYMYFGDILYMIGFASLLAIIIACMGLFGMAAYSSGSRIKEVGIRKAMGARSSSIALLISRSYVRLILFSLVIALPLSWFGNNLWLQNFPYQVNFGFGTLFSGSFLILLFSFLSILSQTMKAARQDPVESLRYE